MIATEEPRRSRTLHCSERRWFAATVVASILAMLGLLSTWGAVNWQRTVGARTVNLVMTRMSPAGQTDPVRFEAPLAALQQEADQARFWMRLAAITTLTGGLCFTAFFIRWLVALHAGRRARVEAILQP